MTSPLEEAIELGIGIGFFLLLCAGIAAGLWEGGSSVWLGLAVLAVSLPARLLTDCTYLLDTETGALRYRRRIGPSVFEETLCELADVQIVTVRGQSKEVDGDRIWKYSTVLLLQDGTSIRVSSPTTFVHDQNRLAEALAEHAGAVYLPGRAEQVLEHVPEVKLPEVIRSDSERGAMREVHLGNGLVCAQMGLLFGLPLFWFTGPWALEALHALWAGTGGLAGAAWAQVVMWISGVFTVPAFFAAARLIDRGKTTAKRDDRSREIEDEGFNRGLDLLAIMVFSNFLLAFLAFFGETLMGGSSLPVARTATAVLAFMNVSLIAGWGSGRIQLDTPEAIKELPDAVRITLLTRLEHRESRCGYCGGLIIPEEVVACNRCEAVHHSDCWDENSRCTTYGCGGDRASPLVA